jgi:peptide-methionine (S)-S-oxide reductase
MIKTLATTSSRRTALVGLAALLVGGYAAFGLRVNAAEQARVIPPYQPDAQAAQAQGTGQGTEEVAVLAGGCFWGVQGVFQHVKGVTSAVSGYAGGEKSTAQYELVGSGTTGHAETVRVVFDPREISYGKILQIFFSVAHDPTQLNRQGPDTGTQYRSALFPLSAEQAATAKAYIAQLNQARVFNAAIVTKIEKDKVFYPAELYHQDFLTKHPTHPYIVYNDLPKIEDLKRIFADEYRAQPVLVTGTKSSS